MVGSVMLLFTGTMGYLMFRFPRFHSIKVAFAVLALVNLLFFVRFREKGRGLWERMMRSDFFPRKLSISKVGRFLVLISLGIGFAAVNTGSNLLYLLMSMLLSIIMGSGILSELSVRKVSMSFDFPGSSVAGEETLFPVRVTNDKGRFNSFSLEGRLLLPDTAEAIHQVPGVVLKLPPRRSDLLFVRAQWPRRGLYPVSGVSLSTSYPFSFFEKSRNVRAPHDVLVVPRGEKDLGDLVTGLGRGFEEHASRSGRGTEFFSVRPMFPGDEWRDVHWKKTARTQQFAVKEYEALQTRRVRLLLWRDSESGENAFEAEEDGIETSASLVRWLLQRGFEVGIWAGAQCHQEPQAGEASLRVLFRRLALLDVSLVPSSTLGAPVDARDLVVRLNLSRSAVDFAQGSPGAAHQGGHA